MAREHAFRLGQVGVRRQGANRAQRGETARRRRHRELVEHAPRRVGHEGLCQHGEVAHRLGEDVEHGRHPRRIGPPQRPRRQFVDIAVGGGNDGPDRLQGPMESLVIEVGPHLAEHRLRRMEQSLVGL